MGMLLGDGIPGAPELAERGNSVMGVRTIMLTDPLQADVLSGMKNGAYPRYDRPLKVEVWYPAIEGTGEEAEYTDFLGRVDLGNLRPYTIYGRALRNAEPDSQSGARPVIVISHGYPGSRILLVNLAENLASKGYVVLSIGHTDNTYEDFPKTGSLESALIHRSLDQRFVIHKLAGLNQEGFLKGLLQTDQVGLIGFSMGGYGALRTIGARMSREALEQFREFAHEMEEPEDFRGLKTVKAAVLFAPATFWFDPAQSEDIDIPTLWFCGTEDRTVYYPVVHTFCEKASNSERIFVSYEGCGHNVANNPAPAEALGTDWETLKRWADPVWDTLRLNNLNFHFVTAFMDKYLKGDAVHAEYLQVEGRGAEKVYAVHPDGTKDRTHSYWKGFKEGTAAGVRVETFEKHT